MGVDQVVKRDGTVVPFERERIEHAIYAAAREVGNGEGRQWAETLSWAVVGILKGRFGQNSHTPQVEEIQDVVEEVLIKSGSPQVAKAFILYRQRRADARAGREMLLDTEKLVESYLQRTDWRVNENSNMNYSLQGLNFYVASSIAARYWLHKIYPPEVQQAHVEGALHLHDLGNLSVYCCGWDLQDLLMQGFGGVPAKVQSKPPRHLRTALGQLINFFYTLQGESAGAVAVSNFDTLLAPFIRYDGLDYEAVKQAVQEYAFNINVPTRVGFQCVSEDTEILARDGWKRYDQVQPGDVIATFNVEKKVIEYLPVQRVFARAYEGPMYRLQNRISDQLVSPGHRVIRKKFNTDEYVLEEIEQVLASKSSFIVPVESEGHLSDTYINTVEEIAYQGVIWCPNTVNETVVARRNGNVFITGNTPFTNQTMDLTPCPTLCDHPVIIGGEMQRVTYGEFQHEMDMLNRAFAEVMLEGDAQGRVFSVDYAAYSLIRENDAIQLVRIGEYIDHKMASAPPVWIDDKQAEVSDVRHLDIEAVGVKAGRVGWYKVNYLVRHPTDRLLKITTAGGFNVKVTPSHSVLVVKDGNIVAYKASDLKPGDYLIGPKSLDSGGGLNLTISLAHEFLRGTPQGIYLHGAKNMDGHPYKEVRISRGQKPYRYKVSVVPLAHTVDILDKLDLSEARLGLAGSNIRIPNNITVDEQLLEFLGYFVAEGSVAKGPSGGISLGFNLAKERELANRLAEWMRKTFGTRAMVRQVPERTLVEIRDHSKLLRRILLEILDIENGVEQKIPHLVFNVPDALKRAFLEGYFGGDAYQTEKSFFVSTIAPGVAYGVSTLLKQLGIAHTLTEHVKDGGSHIYRINLWDPELVGREHRTIGKLPIKASGLKAVLKVMFEQEPRYEDTLGRSYRNSLNRIMTKYGIYHQESVPVEKARRIIEDVQQMGAKVPQGLESLVNSDLIFLKVKTVEESAPTTGMAYDFSTDADSFLANQLLVHNTFPIPTYNVTREFDWENPALEPVWAMTARYGIPYWANFINSDMDPEDARSMCCRLRLDNRELRKRIGGLFAAAPLTGSIGVVTINMSRLGYLAHDEAEFLERLERLMEIAHTSLEIKRNLLEVLTSQGLYPYSYHYLQSVKQRFGSFWNNHFSTIGLIGMNEACLNLLGVGIAHPEGKDFAVRTLEFMRDVLARFQVETDHLYNLEATPAEGASFRLARADKDRFPDILTAGTDQAPYYTNSTHLPVIYSDDIFEVLEHQDELQTLYTGGTVQHIFLGEQVDDWRQARRLVRTIAENFHLPYYTLTPTFSICPVHGYIPGEHKYCPYDHTEEELERFGRIVSG